MTGSRLRRGPVILHALGVLLVPALAHAQSKRLEMFATVNSSQFSHRWSDDGRNGWSEWVPLPVTYPLWEPSSIQQ
jgi:hypothetical protein